MNRLKARIWRFLPQEKKFLNTLYLRFVYDHAYLWDEVEKGDTAKLRYILFTIIKLFYEEHKNLHDLRGVYQREFNRAVKELIANPDALLQKAQKAQIKVIDRLGVERWFNAFKKDIEKMNQIIEMYERAEQPNPLKRFVSNEERLRVRWIIEFAEKDFLYPHDVSTQYWRNILDHIDVPLGNEWREKFNFFAKVLRGKPLLDLGCGDQSFAMIDLAHACGVSRYIGVDKYNVPDIDSSVHLQNLNRNKKLQTSFTDPNFSIEHVKNDLLAYVLTCADESANITINGIDKDLWPNLPTVNEYIRELMKQVARVIPRGGVVIGSGTPFIFGLHDKKFRQLTEIPGTSIRFTYPDSLPDQCLVFQKL